MKLRLETDEKYPIFSVREIKDGDTRLFPYEVVELSDKEWQDYQTVVDAYYKWQDKLADLDGVRVEPDQPEFRSPTYGMGRVWDGRTKDEDDGA
jgi:hypothetical protein